MASTLVSDFVIWAKHIHGEPSVAERIAELRAGQTVDLRVDGVRGVWRKMDDGRDGRPTRGIRPLGRTQDFWRDLYQTRKGDVVTIELAAEDEAAQQVAPLFPSFARSPADREAAAEAFLAAGADGWASDAPYGPRDELYDR